MRLLFLSFFVFFLASPVKRDNKFPFFDYAVNEELVKESTEERDEVFLVKDSLKKPLFYYSNINSSVCYDNTCKPIQLKLFWDVCGNFLGFRVPSGNPLTKKDHKPFTNYDYYALYTILNNPRAEISKMSKQDLVNHNSLAVADAVSGATSPDVKPMVVDGAAYSTYTLWHIVYNSGLKSESGKLIDPPVEIKKMLEGAENLSVVELTTLLYEADHHKLLRKYPIQKLLTGKLHKMSALQALLINNYLQHQPYLSNDIKVNLKESVVIQKVFSNMLPF